MGRNIYISEFDSESKFRDASAYSLPVPAIFGSRNRFLVGGMDTLAAAMADAGDVLVTLRRLPQAYMQYWRDNICDIGFFTPAEADEEDEEDASIYRRLTSDESARSLLREGRIVNYALVPAYYEMCDALGIAAYEPGADLIRELNSKAYSNELKLRLGLPGAGLRVCSPDEFDNSAALMLAEHGRFLIKDSMGVSGRGMLLIDSGGMAERLAARFRRQEESGRTGFDFILEPLHEKKTDFSCLLHIDEPGEMVIDGLRRNDSRGYAYLGSGPVDEISRRLILSSGYEEQVMSIAEDMSGRGYRGFVCIDSMILADDSIMPLVEINPRMSMSRFSLMLEERTGADCRLGYIEGKSSGSSSEELLAELEAKGLLYTEKRGCGVIPLAPRCWDMPDAAGKRIRIYYAIIYRSDKEYEEILAAWLAHCSGSICAGPVS